MWKISTFGFVDFLFFDFADNIIILSQPMTVDEDPGYESYQ